MNEINRRSFLQKILKTTAAVTCAPLMGSLQSCIPKSGMGRMYPATESSFPLLEVTGSYYDIGYAVGFHFGDEIHHIFTKRKNWFNTLKLFVQMDKERYFYKLKDMADKHFPHLVQELRGMSDGANIPFEDLFLLNVKAEIGARMKQVKTGTPGCSTIYLIQNTQCLICHNEDGTSAYDGSMFMVKATPPSGVSFIVLVYPGTFCGNGPGINNQGIVQTTNYIAGAKSNVGVPRYVLNRAVLEARTLDEAVKIATYPQRAFAYHHNLASFKERRILSVEVTPDTHDIFEPRGLYFHTNHLILEKTKAFPQEKNYVQTSSMSRFSVISSEISRLSNPKKVMERDILDILSSHQKAPYSPCRHPKDKVQGVTLGTAIIDVMKGTMRIYKGSPCIAREKGWVKEYCF